MNTNSFDYQIDPHSGRYEAHSSAWGMNDTTGSAHVLIVDDEADVVQALKLRLETAGYRASTVSDGAEALTLLRGTSVDLILTDLMMPKLDGLELTRRICQDPALLGMRVMLLSANDDPVARKLATEFGALDYLSKAIGAREIVSRVERLLKTANPTVSTHKPQQQAAAEAALGAQLRALSQSSMPPAHRKEAVRWAQAGTSTNEGLPELALALQRDADA